MNINDFISATEDQEKNDFSRGYFITFIDKKKRTITDIKWSKLKLGEVFKIYLICDEIWKNGEWNTESDNIITKTIIIVIQDLKLINTGLEQFEDIKKTIIFHDIYMKINNKTTLIRSISPRKIDLVLR